MAQERVFTDEDRDWLKDNYPHLSNTSCLKKLKCGFESLKKLIAECGLEYHNQTNPNTKFIAKKENKFVWSDKDATERCMDCKRYMQGGICSKTGKDVGALWQKRCFE